MEPKGVPKSTQINLRSRLGLLGASWALLGRSWPLLGRSWALLGGSWAALGRSWAALGRSWAALGRLLGGSWALLGVFPRFGCVFRIKPRKNRGFKSHFMPKPRFLRCFKQQPTEAGFAGGTGAEPGGGDLGELPAVTLGVFIELVAMLHKSLRSRPLVEPDGSVAGSPVGLRPQYLPLSQGSFVFLA